MKHWLGQKLEAGKKVTSGKSLSNLYKRSDEITFGSTLMHGDAPTMLT